MTSAAANAPAAASPRKAKMVIVGSGPAGLTAGIYAGRAGLKPVIAAGSVDGNSLPGGQLMITTEVENFPGFPEGIDGPQLMDRLFQQAKRFDCEIVEEFATEFRLKQSGPFLVKIGATWFEADSLVLANGAAARWLQLPEEHKFRNNGISACATCDGPLPVFRNRELYVVGGGDSACEEALFLTKFASKVYIVHRRDQLRASRIMADRVLQHANIEVLWNNEVVEYIGDDSLTGIKLRNRVTGEVTDVKCSGVFMAIGHEPNTKALQGSGVDMDAQGYIVVKDQVYTNIDGVFACGDCHDTKFRQAVSAAGFGCMAAIAAERWLDANEAQQH